MVAPLMRDVKSAKRGAQNTVMVAFVLEQHCIHAAPYGVVLLARYLQTVDRAGNIGVPGHVALRDVLTHQARGQRTARVQPRKAV